MLSSTFGGLIYCKLALYDFFYGGTCTLSITAVERAHKLNKAHIESFYDNFSAHLMIVIGKP